MKVGLYADGKRTDIAVKANEKTLAYDGTVTAPSSATFIVTGARLPQIWATTPEGLKQITRKTASATNPYKGYPHSAAFAMGKFALRGLAQSTARELGPKGMH